MRYGVGVQVKDGGKRTFNTLPLPLLSFTSTTPSTVSPNLHACFVNVNTATLTPSLCTSYDTFFGTRVRISTASRQPRNVPVGASSRSEVGERAAEGDEMGGGVREEAGGMREEVGGERVEEGEDDDSAEEEEEDLERSGGEVIEDGCCWACSASCSKRSPYIRKSPIEPFAGGGGIAAHE